MSHGYNNTSFGDTSSTPPSQNHPVMQSYTASFHQTNSSTSAQNINNYQIANFSAPQAPWDHRNFYPQNLTNVPLDRFSSSANDSYNMTAYNAWSPIPTATPQMQQQMEAQGIFPHPQSTTQQTRDPTGFQHPQTSRPQSGSGNFYHPQPATQQSIPQECTRDPSRPLRGQTIQFPLGAVDTEVLMRTRNRFLQLNHENTCLRLKLHASNQELGQYKQEASEVKRRIEKIRGHKTGRETVRTMLAATLAYIETGTEENHGDFERQVNRVEHIATFMENSRSTAEQQAKAFEKYAKGLDARVKSLEKSTGYWPFLEKQDELYRRINVLAKTPKDHLKPWSSKEMMSLFREIYYPNGMPKDTPLNARKRTPRDNTDEAADVAPRKRGRQATSKASNASAQTSTETHDELAAQEPSQTPNIAVTPSQPQRHLSPGKDYSQPTTRESSDTGPIQVPDSFQTEVEVGDVAQQDFGDEESERMMAEIKNWLDRDNAEQGQKGKEQTELPDTLADTSMVILESEAEPEQKEQESGRTAMSGGLSDNLSPPSNSENKENEEYSKSGKFQGYEGYEEAVDTPSVFDVELEIEKMP